MWVVFLDNFPHHTIAVFSRSVMSDYVRVLENKSVIAKEDRISQAQKSNYSQPANSSVDRILFLQRTIGNQAVWRLLAEIGRVPSASQQATVQRQELEEDKECLQCTTPEAVQRKPEPEEDGEEPVQRKFTDEYVQYKSDIHIAPGQEKYIPHEAWHVVQQKQGRVKPTMQMKGGVNVNDGGGLEKEADLMGEKALNMPATTSTQNGNPSPTDNQVIQRKIRLLFRSVQSLDEIEDEVKKKLSSLLEGRGVNTLEEALDSKQTFWFRKQSGKTGEYTLTIIDPEEESKVEEKPKFISSISTSKPAVDLIQYVEGDDVVFVNSTNGAHHLEISGLIGCVGIIAEKKSRDSIQAAATHLLDTHYKNGEIDEDGRGIIDKLLHRVGLGSSDVTITLVVSGKVHLDKMYKPVSQYIHEKYGEVEPFGQFTSEVYYSVTPG